MKIDEKIFIPGLATKNLNEKYFTINIESMEITSFEIDINKQREQLNQFLEKNIDESCLPYDLTEIKSLIPYYLHPHSFIQNPETKDIFIFYKQAPYFRVVRNNPFESKIFPKNYNYDSIISSTNSFSKDKKSIYLTKSSGKARIKKYKNTIETIPFNLEQFIIEKNEFKKITTIKNTLIDTIHQVHSISDDIFIGVDMNVSTRLDKLDGILNIDSSLDKYIDLEFPFSKYFVYHKQKQSINSSVEVISPKNACAAHVVTDPIHENTFYISCHNLSKYKNNVVCHGQASIEKYSIINGETVFISHFTHKNLFRMTTHECIEINGESLILAVSYPNLLYIINAKDLSIFKIITLFEIESVKAPFVCKKNTEAPLYIAISSHKKHVFLSGSTTIFIIDLVNFELVKDIKFCEKGEFMATSHIGMIE